jgi:diguanylate cyclase (GGDEF)-like protein
MAASLRKGDFLGRIGGDEFLIVLDRCQEHAQAATVADKLIAAVGAREPDEAGYVPVGASVGIAMFPTDGTQLGALIQHADDAMYRAKQSGGNRFDFTAPELRPS